MLKIVVRDGLGGHAGLDIHKNRACATQVYHVYIGSALWGLGMVFSGSTIAGMIVQRWFHQDVGRYTGIVMSANGIGGAVAAQIITPLINNGEVFGYRKAYQFPHFRSRTAAESV